MPWGKSPQHPLNRRLGRSQSWSGCSAKNRNYGMLHMMVESYAYLACWFYCR